MNLAEERVPLPCAHRLDPKAIISKVESEEAFPERIASFSEAVRLRNEDVDPAARDLSISLSREAFAFWGGFAIRPEPHGIDHAGFGGFGAAFQGQHAGPQFLPYDPQAPHLVISLVKPGTGRSRLIQIGHQSADLAFDFRTLGRVGSKPLEDLLFELQCAVAIPVADGSLEFSEKVSYVLVCIHSSVSFPIVLLAGFCQLLGYLQRFVDLPLHFVHAHSPSLEPLRQRMEGRVRENADNARYEQCGSGFSCTPETDTVVLPGNSQILPQTCDHLVDECGEAMMRRLLEHQGCSTSLQVNSEVVVRNRAIARVR
jgi:hypothetical protein